MQIELVPTGPDQAELIANLYQFYAYESSDWEQEDVEVDGRFYIHQPHLQRYWQEEDWSAQLILADGFIAGFVLIERSEIPGIDALELADLFVLKKYRRIGIGRAVAEQVLLNSPHRWLLSYYPQDPLAAAFCQALLARFPGQRLQPLLTPEDPTLRSSLIAPGTC